MMKEIHRTAIVGMGALGLLFGQMIRRRLGSESITFLMDRDRLARHSQDRYTINGETVTFRMEDISACGPFDLVIVAVKYGGLEETIRQMAPAVGPDTLIVSVMNGITSEQQLARRYDRDHIIDCVAIGMDAMREGTALHYTKAGRLQIGALDRTQQENLAVLAAFFERAGVPCELVPDIRYAMWNKFMLNVGINQCCTAYETDYQHATSPGPICEEMIRAMQEVIDIAQALGIPLTAQDLENNLRLEKTLKPEGYPSMRQDAVAHRPTEVDMFAGTVIRLGKETGIPTPVNEKYERMIRQIESRYQSAPISSAKSL